MVTNSIYLQFSTIGDVFLDIATWALCHRHTWQGFFCNYGRDRIGEVSFGEHCPQPLTNFINKKEYAFISLKNQIIDLPSSQNNDFNFGRMKYCLLVAIPGVYNRWLLDNIEHVLILTNCRGISGHQALHYGGLGKISARNEKQKV